LVAGVFHGFSRRAVFRGVKLRRIDYPTAEATSAVGCNDLHDIVGFFRNSNKELHGFVWLNGATPSQPFDLEGGSALIADNDVVGVSGINNNRLVVGAYQNMQGRKLGFVARGDDTVRPVREFIPIDMQQEVPSGVQVQLTRLNGINSQGEIVGSYNDATGSHAFKWKVRVNPDNSLSMEGSPEFLQVNMFDVTASGISDNSIIVGNDNVQSRTDLDTNSFELKPSPTNPTNASDTITPVEVMSALKPRRTFANSINSGGTIVGAPVEFEERDQFHF
jgi:hypothetical protein